MEIYLLIIEMIILQFSAFEHAIKYIDVIVALIVFSIFKSVIRVP